ncbi:hypothetical protein LR69_01417 [Geobacillus sp. BCO2]|nr:hypothetical protein LR69_01417 [Geobacillus sp. BCO2]
MDRKGRTDMLQTTISKPLLRQAAEELVKELPYPIFTRSFKKDAICPDTGSSIT